MHEKFPSLHRGGYKANLLKNGRTRWRKKFLSRLNFNRVTHFRRSLSFRNDLKSGFWLVLKKVDFWCEHDEACARKKGARLTTSIRKRSIDQIPE